MMKLHTLLFIFIISCSLYSCCDIKNPTEGENTYPPPVEGQTTNEPEGTSSQEGTTEGIVSSSFWNYPQPFTLTYRIISKYPHDSTAFTQGLVWSNGILYESTGLYDKSSIRIVELESGIPLLNRSLPQEYNGQTLGRVFGEGIALVNNWLFQLTWREGICFVYSSENLELQKAFSYSGEGWGLTYDGTYLIMSDGSATLSYREPETFQVIKTILVQEQGIPVSRLNELEFIDGYICANVWYKDYIVVINPETGEVVGEIDLSGLKNQLSNPEHADVLNGIAFRNDNNHLLVTGKLWDTLFEIELLPK